MSDRRSSKLGSTMFGLLGIAILIGAVYSLTAARFSGDGETDTPKQVTARIAPLGAGNRSAAEPEVAAPGAILAVDEGSGLAVYNKACAACHTTGAANAPKLGDRVAWQPRLAKDIDQLLQTAIAGMGTMPPRGTCMDCSDDDLKLAIEYMLVRIGYERAVPGAL